MRLSYFVRSLIQTVKKFIYRGNKYYCPFCASGYSKFLPMGSPSRANARCPGCNALERHRLLKVGLDHLQAEGKLNTGGRLLHIAPEKFLARELFNRYEYVSADLFASGVQVKVDVTALCFADACFDAIVCNHVLEHVPDDRKAISELYRVLKPGGWGSIQVPMKGDATFEDLSVVDPVERTRLYGQHDHVRQYGEDYKGRLESAGFSLLELTKHELLDQSGLDRLSVACERGILLVVKPSRHKEVPITNQIKPLSPI